MATSFVVYGLAEGMRIRYVGYSERPKRRQKAHRQAHPTWHWLVLGAYPTREAGLAHERWWIKRLYGAGHPLTNVSEGGDWCPTGISMSDLTKARLADAKKGKPLSAEWRRKLSAAHMGQRPWNKGVPNSPSARAKMSASHRGKKHTDETRAKMSAARKGHPGYTRGKKHSEQTKAKMSASHKARFARMRDGS